MLDLELVGRLTAGAPFGTAAESRICDHSVEIQLPLLQKAAPGARIVPLYVGYLDQHAREEAARRLAEVLSPYTVLVASSDLTHYGSSFGFKPFPADNLIADRLRDLDDEVIEAAGSLREQFFLETLRRTEATVCGFDPIALLVATVRLLKGETRFSRRRSTIKHRARSRAVSTARSATGRWLTSRLTPWNWIGKRRRPCSSSPGRPWRSTRGRAGAVYPSSCLPASRRSSARGAVRDPAPGGPAPGLPGEDFRESVAGASRAGADHGRRPGGLAIRPGFDLRNRPGHRGVGFVSHEARIRPRRLSGQPPRRLA